MKDITFWLPRLAASLVLVGTVAYLLSHVPDILMRRQIVAEQTELSRAQSSLELRLRHLERLPSPSSVTPRRRDSARAYMEILVDRRKHFEEELRLPPVSGIWNPLGQEPLREFNALVASASYKEARASAQAAADRGRSLLGHHTEVMRALANLLEYDPAIDLAGDDPEQLKPRLEKTRAGLEKTRERLKSAPSYPGSGVTELLSQVDRLQSSRAGLAASLEAGLGLTPTQKETFFTAVETAQEATLTSRSRFWGEERIATEAALRTASNGLSVQLTRLELLRNRR